jgi:addiction module RelE/StbE family toxin
MPYRVVSAPAAERDLKSLRAKNAEIFRVVKEAILALGDDPFPVGKHKRFYGIDDGWRIHVRRKWRVVYSVDEENFVITIHEVNIRGKSYRSL